MQIILEPGGKKGSGPFIAACKIDLKRDKKTRKYQLDEKCTTSIQSED